MLNYKSLMRAVADHVNEWHLTDDDGVRRCGLVTDCLLDQIQGYMPDDGLPEGHGDPSEEGHDSLVVEVVASVRQAVHRIERVDSASTATRGDDDDDAFVLALLDSVDEVTGVWRGSDRATAKLDQVELLTYTDGPTVRATIDADGSVTVRGIWRGREVERLTWAGMLAEHLFGMLGD